MVRHVRTIVIAGLAPSMFCRVARTRVHARAQEDHGVTGTSALGHASVNNRTYVRAGALRGALATLGTWKRTAAG